MLFDGAILVCSLVSTARLTHPPIKIVAEVLVHMLFKVSRMAIFVIHLQTWFQL